MRIRVSNSRLPGVYSERVESHDGEDLREEVYNDDEHIGTIAYVRQQRPGCVTEYGWINVAHPNVRVLLDKLDVVTNLSIAANSRRNLAIHAALMGSEHEHVWGPLEMTTQAIRRCQVDGCQVINAYDDDEEDMDPDEYTHMFRTAFGIPPSKDDLPICGAELSDAYDFPNTDRPGCIHCQRVAARART